MEAVEAEQSKSSSARKSFRELLHPYAGVFLTPAGATIAAISFFLPCIRISCLGTKSYSGYDIGGNFWIVPAAAVIIILGFVATSLYRRMGLMRFIVPACTVVVAAVVAYTCLTMPSGKRILLVKIGPDDVNLRLFFGAYSMILGFVLSLIGSQILPRVDRTCELPEPQCPQTENPSPVQKREASETA